MSTPYNKLKKFTSKVRVNKKKLKLVEDYFLISSKIIKFIFNKNMCQ